MEKMKKVLVTGADGFIGSHLVELLVRKGYNVSAFCLYNSFGSTGWLDNLDNSIKENEMSDILNDHFQINVAFDSIISTLSQPGVDKSFILKLKCTSLPYADWKIPDINENAIPKNYSVCIKPTLLPESSYLDLNALKGKPGIYIIYSKPNNGITYNSTPVRRIFCRPKPFCKS